jgi:nitrate reductase delta subunit
MLGESAEILRALGDRLALRGSRYALVFAALLADCGEGGLTQAIAARRSAGEESSPAALDKSWMDEPVTFMGAAQPVKFYAKGARP